MENQHENINDDLRERRRLAFDARFYSLKRMDIMIVAMCGAGIYLCLQFMEKCYDEKTELSGYVIAGGLSFLVSITFNFLSQIFSAKANASEIRMYDAYLKREYEEGDRHDKKAEQDFINTSNANNVSIALLLIGLYLIAFYLLIIFLEASDEIPESSVALFG